MRPPHPGVAMREPEQQLDRESAESLLLQHLGLVERICRSIARRRCLRPEDAEDFAAAANLHLVERDYAVLRAWKGKASLKTYLVTVLQRAYVDFQVRRFGKWRPSSAAMRSGPLAVELERLVSQRGHTPHEAIEIVRRRANPPVSRSRLEEVLERLPERPRPREENPERLESLPGPERADVSIELRERRRVATDVESSLRAALEELDPLDRRIVELKFERGAQTARVARTLGLEQRPLYRRVERLERRLRVALEARGVTGATVEYVLGWLANDPPARETERAEPGVADLEPHERGKA